MRTSILSLTAALSPGLLACEPKDDLLTELTLNTSTSTSTTGSDESGDEPTGTTSPTTSTTTGPPPAAGGLDILFVVDNSGSMADAQAKLAQAAASLVAAAGERDLRVGITTTDNGNPRCPSATYTPEGGRMATDSCLERVQNGEFEFNMNVFESACTDHCSHSSLQIMPTATAQDPDEKPRPWFERIGGASNVDVPLAEALACSLPQGVAGCGFESQLQSMRAALTKATSPTEPEYGFLRDDADLVVVFVTDEMDCSSEPDFAEIFTTNKVFWNDPGDPAPSSALCFRAGVECVGDGPTYESCPAADKDVSGGVTDDPSQAVLRPAAEYVDFLNLVQAGKTAGSVRLLAIAGVPSGFEDGSTPLVFEDAADQNYQADFGLGPGCVTGEGQPAFPPLRILDVAQGLGPPRFFSICGNSFDAAMSAVAGP